MAAKEKKGLGTGLAALFADADILQDDAPLKVLPIGKIEPRADQPRKIFDDESLAERLKYEMPNIIHVGMLKNGDVKPKPCGVCDYCRSKKKIKKAINWRQIGGELENGTHVYDTDKGE